MRKMLITGMALLVAGTLWGESLEERIKKGKEIALNRTKGNCLACHMMDDGDLPGNTAPPLMMMSQRYPSKAALRAQIWDPTVKNPNTFMPPFGKHKILSDQEVDLVADYVYSL
jgi:sulfur-oxidizing protein SoxX